MGLDAVAPTSPGHWPLHLASSLKRPGRENPPFLTPIGQLTAWPVLLTGAAHLQGSLFCPQWLFQHVLEGWLGRVCPARQAEMLASLGACQSIPYTAGGSPEVGMGPSPACVALGSVWLQVAPDGGEVPTPWMHLQ